MSVTKKPSPQWKVSNFVRSKISEKNLFHIVMVIELCLYNRVHKEISKSSILMPDNY